MEPPIQYTHTSDGVNIAYWTYGQGSPLVYMPHPVWGTAHSLWRLPQARAWYERIGQAHTLVRYDARGTGRSERHADDYSMDAHVRDLSAVVNAAGLDQFALLGFAQIGPAAVAYAAAQPERVSHLILWCTLIETSHYIDSPRFQAFSSLRSMVDREWQLYVDTMANLVYGAAFDSEARREVAVMMSESVAPGELAAIMEGHKTFSVLDCAGQVTARTLVVDRAGVRVFPEGESMRLASSIPGARLVMLEGDQASPYLGDQEATARLIDEFTGIALNRHAVADAGVVAILFTDITDSTALTQHLGDARAQELVHAHNDIVREALGANGGTEIKHTGDGIMASFSTASSALECAIGIQRAVALRCDEHLSVHAGINAGEPVVEDADLFGTAVQLARRLCDTAQPGQVLVSDVVRQLAAGKGYLFADIGEVIPKGFDEAVRLYELRWQD